jgi:hypothetical protein
LVVVHKRRGDVAQQPDFPGEYQVSGDYKKQSADCLPMLHDSAAHDGLDINLASDSNESSAFFMDNLNLSLRPEASLK